MPRWTVPPIWKMETCWIIGGGTSLPRVFNVPEELVTQVCANQQPISAYSPYLAALHNKHVIGVNNAYMLGDWIDVLFFGDCAWFNVHRLAIAQKDFIKVSCCDRFQNKSFEKCEGVHYLFQNPEYGISNDPTDVRWNHNSGAAAISLAAHFGCRRIILLGFDMSLDSTNTSHWFGYHRKGVVPPFKRHMKGMDAIANDAKERGIEILNASPISKITQFEKVNALDLLEEEDQ